jgi:N-acetylglucosamine-6-phosphate deacetylase
VPTVLTNARVFLGGALVEGRSVVLAEGRVSAVVPDRDSTAQAGERIDLGGRMLLPGFVDLQVNGGGGVLFNDAPTVESIRAIGAAHRRYGTTAFLPTLITDHLDVVERAIAAADAAIEARVPGAIGIHLEGPFISVERKGAHDAAKIRPLGLEHVGLLTSVRRGKTIVTLAPEVAAPGAIRALVAAGVVVSVGHSNASADVTLTAFRDGARKVTHLFNAMSPLMGRAPGVVGAALADEQAWCGIIVDGRHVDPMTLRVAVAARRHDRFVLVSDAMPTVGSARKSFQLNGKQISVKNGVCVNEAGTLSGSDLDMVSAVRNAIEMVGLPFATAVKMATEYPAACIGLDHELGRIAPGYRASLVAVDDEWRVHATWIDGEVTRN